MCPEGWSARRAVPTSALQRTGVVAVAVPTPDLTVLLVDDVLAPLTPSRLTSGGLRSRLRGKDLAYADGAFAAVGPAAAVGDGVNGRLLRHGEPLFGIVLIPGFCPAGPRFVCSAVGITLAAPTRVSAHRPFPVM